MKEYWVVIENGTPAQWGLLQHCKDLLGNGVMALVREEIPLEPAWSCGAEKVYVLQGQADARQAAQQISQLAENVQPEAILFTADRQGRMTAAAVATLLKTGLAADCTQIDQNTEGLLIMTRPTFGGSLLADIICPESRPQMATVRPGIYLPREQTCGNAGEIVCVPPADRAPDAVLLDRVVSEVQNLALAKVIVAGGKGVGSAEGFRLLEQLATAMGGCVGATRAAVNAGFATYEQQIGLTGKTVRPDVYLAFGISGAVQHVVAMEKSGVVIAVNEDPKAPIFEYADYGIVGDWETVAKELLQRFLQES